MRRITHATFWVLGITSFARADDVPAPPPPPTTSPQTLEITEFRTLRDGPPEGLAEALWAHDRDAALATFEEPASPAVACIEALLRDHVLRETFVASAPPTDHLALEVFEAMRETIESRLDAAARASQRCVATIDAIPTGTVTVVSAEGVDDVELAPVLEAVRARHRQLASARRALETEDPIRAHATLRWLVRTDPISDPVTTDPVTTDPVTNDPVTNDPVTNDPVVTDPVVTDPATDAPTWPAAIALYTVAHGRLPIPGEPKVEPNWRSTAFLVGGIHFALGVALLPATFRADGLDDARVRMALLGVAVGGVVGLILGPTWSERGRRRRVLAGGLLVAGALALGLGTALADVRPRLRAFGAALTASAATDLALLVGGGIVQRRWRPIVTASRHHGALAWHASF